MNILRRLFLSLLAALLSACLLSLAWSNVALSTIHNRTVVKSWFDKSDFYNKIVDVVLENAKTSATDNGGLPIKDPKLQAIAKQAFTPELLKKSVNSILDGSYNWLAGSSQNIDFKIDLTSAKQQLADGVGSYVKDRVAALPVCANGTNITNFDSFNSTCRPNGLSPEEAGANAKSDLLTQDFLKDPVITADSIKPSKNGASTTTKLTEDKRAQLTRTAYQRSSQLPILLAAVALVLILGIVFVSSERSKGLGRVGYIFVSNGVLLLVIYVVLSKAFSAASTKVLSGDNNTAAASLGLSFAKAALDSVKHVMVWFVVIYVVLGVAAIVLSKVLFKPKKPPVPTPPIPRHADLTPVTEEEKAADKPAENKTPAENTKELENKG